MSPRRVLEEHTSRDLNEWMAYFQLEDVEGKRDQTTARLEGEVKQ